jgi:glycosyltransferase involved in cell wall biosynthesis
MPSKPLVSVVMPAYNAERFIGEALASALSQTYEPVEVIVVDDGSTDRTAEIAAAHDATVLRQGHAGSASARNAGLKRASGDYWTILDADDVMPLEALEQQVAELGKHPEPVIVFGLTEAFVTPGEPRPPHWNRVWDDGPFPWHATAMLACRELFELVGPFDEARRFAEDMDWLARAKAAGVRAVQGDYLALHYRVHGANSTADTGAVDREMLSVLRASARRQRGQRADG